MKKLLIAALLLASATSSYAQISVGAGYRGTYKTYNYSNVWYNGFYLGADYNYALSEYFGVASGLYFARQSHSETVEADNGLSVDTTIKDAYLSVPLYFTAGYTVAKDLRVSLFVGPMISMDIASSIDTKTTSLGATAKGSVDSFESDPNYKRFDCLVGGGLAIDYKFVRLSAGYNYGLLDRDADADGTLHRHGLHIGLAYIF